MKAIIAVIVLINLYVAFGLYVGLTQDQLPPKVATHFNLHGDAEGWMTRSGHVRMMLLFGFGFPLLIVGLCALTRFFPARMFNLPHRNYWLAPERRGATAGYLVRQSVWLACLTVGLFIGIHFSVLKANQQSPAHLPQSVLWLILGAFLAGVLAWSLFLHRHFKHSPE